MDSKHIAIIGGGPAGLEASASLAQLGYQVTLIEKEGQLGGNLKNWYSLFPDKRPAGEVLQNLISRTKHQNIEVLTHAQVTNIAKVNTVFEIQVNKNRDLKADALLMATGFELFNATEKEEYGYGIYPGVITSAELEKMFTANQVHNAKGEIPWRVILLHCVGSRDEKVGNNYCSKVCCVTAVKQAIEIKKRHPGTEVFCYYMDIRMFGPYYEELYREAQEKWDVVFIRGKISEAASNHEGILQIKAEDTLAGKPLRMNCDLLVLMVGMVSQPSKADQQLGLERGINRFFKSADNHLMYNKSSMEGVFTAGACAAPMNITDTITNARAASLSIHEYLKN
jgi:heterodisulfide reductase subunit A2